MVNSDRFTMVFDFLSLLVQVSAKNEARKSISSVNDRRLIFNPVNLTDDILDERRSF